MVKRIMVFEDRRLEIEFYYRDQYRIMVEADKRIKDGETKGHKTDNRKTERSA